MKKITITIKHNSEPQASAGGRVVREFSPEILCRYDARRCAKIVFDEAVFGACHLCDGTGYIVDKKTDKVVSCPLGCKINLYD